MATSWLSACSQEDLSAPAAIADNGISGVNLGMSENDVLELLGGPNAREDNALGDYAALEYEGLSIALRASGSRLDSPKVVDGIWATSPEHCYDEIICPGVNVNRIMERLGAVTIQPATADKPQRLFYLLPDAEACWLWVYTDDGLIANQVRLVCQP